MRELEIFDTPDDLTEAAARFVVQVIQQAIETHKRCTLALAGGTTPEHLYNRLAEAYRVDVDWRYVHVYWGDERPVPPEDPRSNYGMAERRLLRRVPLPLDQIHRMETEGDAEAAMREYEALLRRNLGPLPRFDLILLGMGDDGHTASLFPHTPALQERARLAVVNPVPEIGPRLTLTYPVLNNAACVLFLVTGAKKVDALHEVLEGDDAPQQYPAQAVLPTQGRVLWWVDRLSAGRLRANAATTGLENTTPAQPASEE